MACKALLSSAGRSRNAPAPPANIPTQLCALHAAPFVRTEGQAPSFNASRDTDQPARVGVGTRLGSTHRAGGTRHSESRVSCISESFE